MKHRASSLQQQIYPVLVTSATAEIMLLMWFVCLFICLSFCLCAEHFWTAGQRMGPIRTYTFVWRTSNTYTSAMTYTNWIKAPGWRHADLKVCMYLWRFHSYVWYYTLCSVPLPFVCELDITHSLTAALDQRGS